MTDLAALFAAAEIPFRGGECITPRGDLLGLFFTEKAIGVANHGTEAKAICAGCPIREACLLGALARNEEHGIWGGAGEQRRRTLRRAQAADRAAAEAWHPPLAVPDPELPRIWAAHWRRLDGEPADGDRFLLAGFGVGATHGLAATYAKGCRCDPCSLAVALRTADTKLRPPRGGRPPVPDFILEEP